MPVSGSGPWQTQRLAAGGGSPGGRGPPAEAGPTALAWTDFRQRLLRYVAKRVEPAWTDDVTGDILLRLLTHHEELSAARDPLAWAYRVGANVIADHYRRRAAELRALDRAVRLPGGTDPAGEPEGAEGDAAMRRDLEACLLPFVRELPPKYAEALNLTAFQGLTQPEAARRAGIGTSGMKSRVQRARVLLRQRFLACCEFEFERRGGVIDLRPRRGRGVQTAGP